MSDEVSISSRNATRSAVESHVPGGDVSRSDISFLADDEFPLKGTLFKGGGSKPLVLISSAIMAASLVIPLIAPSVAGMFAFAGLFGLGYGVYLSVDSALMNEVLPTADAAAKDLGILTIATTLPQALTPLIVWALIALTGSYTSVFLAGIVFALAGALTVLPIRGVR